MSILKETTDLSSNDIAFAMLRGGGCKKFDGALMPNDICACIQY